MGRIDPFMTYFGAAGLVIGSIGLTFSGDRPAASSEAARPSVIAEVEAPDLATAPVAFYAETLELIKPPVKRAQRAVSEEPARPTPATRVTQAPPPEQATRIRERRSSKPTQVIVHQGKNVLVYEVEREGP